MRYDKLLIERREVDLHYCKNNMENIRNVELGDQARVLEEEKSKNMEVGHQNASYCRPTTSQVDVGNLLEECNNEKELGRDGATSPCRVSTENSARSHASQENAISRSNSRDLLGSP